MQQPKKKISNGLSEQDNSTLIKELETYANEGATDDQLREFKNTFISAKKKSTAKTASPSTSVGTKSDSQSGTASSGITNFEKRINNPSLSIKNKDGSESTHKMMSFEADGGYYAAPTIVEINGKLKELPAKEAIDFALKNKEYKKFNTEKEAQNYANNGYKKGTPLDNYITRQENSLSIPKVEKATNLRDEKLNAEIDSAYPVGSIAWSQEKLKANVPNYTSIYDDFKKTEAVDDNEKQRIVQEVEADAENSGVFNTLKSAAGKIINPIYRAFTEWETPKEGQKRPELINSDPLEKEKTEAKKLLQQQILSAKAQKKPIPDITPEAITQKAKEIAIDKRVKSQSDSQVRELLKSYDSDNPDKQDALLRYTALEKASLGEKDKLLVGKQNILRSEIGNSFNTLKEYNSQIKELSDKGIPIPDELKSSYEGEATKYQSLLNDAIASQNEYISNQKNLGDLKDNLDVFKRDYGWMSNFVGNIDATIGDLSAGLAGAIDYGLNAKSKLLNSPLSDAMDAPFRSMAKGVAKDLKSDADETRNNLMKPISVDDINTPSDFGTWFSNTVLANQVPIFAMIATGVPGIASLGVSATGQKFEEMQGEDADYSTAQQIGIPFGFGATETASAMVDRMLLGNASRVIRSATAPERKLIADGVWKGIVETAGNIAKGGAYEGIDESGTQIAQNIIDKYAGDKKNVEIFDKVKDAGYAGSVMGMMIPLSSSVVAEAVKPFNTDNRIQKATDELVNLEAQLANPDITEESRNIISKQAEKAKSNVESLLKTKVKDIEGLSDTQFQEIIKLEKKQSGLRSQAREIQLDNSLDQATKDQVTKELKEEFDVNNQRRIDLIERGGNVSLNTLEEEDLIKLQDQASRELMKEKNPDGTRNITITEQEINKRAGQILNNQIRENERDQSIAESTQNNEEVPVITNEIASDQQVEIIDETAQENNTPTDGNIQPRVTVLEENTDAGQQDTSAEDISESTVSGPSESVTKIKLSDKGGEFDVTFNKGTLDIRDKNGKEPSTPTKRKIEEKYSESFDFTKGEIAPATEESVEPNKYIADKSNNPAEVAEALLSLDNQSIREGADYKKSVISENIGKINRQSFIDNSDANNIGASLAKSYFSNDGSSLDTLAQEMSEIANIEITEQDIVDFMLENPNGSQSYENRLKREAREPLQKRFTELTGLPANDKYLQKAVQQSAENNNFVNNYMTSLDSMTDDQLSELYNESIQSNQDGQETNIADTSTENGNEAENSSRSREEPSVQGESRQDDRTDQEGEINAQGIAGSQGNQRDLTLSEKGAVRDLARVQRKFKRLWNQTFKSNAGLDNRVGEVVRSKNRDIASFTDAMNYETNLFKKLLSDVKKKNSGNFNDKLLAINDYLAGQNPDVSFLTEEQKSQLDYFRTRIDVLSEKIITILETKLSDMKTRQENAKNALAKSSIGEAIERTESLINTIKENKASYLNRTYQIFVDDNYANIITQKADEINSAGRTKINNAVDFLVKEEGYSKEDAEQYVAEYLDAIKRSRNDINFIQTAKANAPFLKKRKDIPLAFRELLGESKDPIFNFVNTTYKLSSYIANLEYQSRLRDILTETGLGKTNPEQGYTKLTADGDGWQTLSDMYVPNELKESLDDMAPLKQVDSGFYKAWIKLAAFTKIGKTIASPTTTMRNIISGVFLGANSGHFFLTNPKFTAEAFNQAWNTPKSFTQLKAEREKLIKLGILGDGGNAGELMAIVNDFSRETSRMISQNKFLYAFDILKKIYAFGDDFYKVTGFYIEKGRLLDAGISDAEAETMAAERIRNSYPTYSYLPKNFQRLRRIPVAGTFISFPYEMVRTTKNNLNYIRQDIKEGRKKLAFQRAAGMLVANASLPAISAFTLNMIGFDDEDDDALRDMLPEWQKNSKLIYTGTKDGKPTFIDGTALFPSEVVMRPLSIILEDRAGRTIEDKVDVAVNDFLSPYISQDISFKTVMQLINNRDQYDEKIYKGDDIASGFANDADQIINFYLKQAGPGVYNNITELLRANEIAPEFFGDKYASFGKEYTNKEALLGLLGFRISTINYNSAITSFGFKTKDILDFDRKEVIKNLKTSKELTQEEVKEISKKYLDANKEANAQLINIVSGGKKLGMSEKDIKNALVRSGYSKADAGQLSKQDIPKLKKIAEQSKNRYMEKLEVNYGKIKSADLKKSFKKNLKLFDAEINRLNREILKENQAKEED